MTETLKLPRSTDWPRLHAQWLKDHPTCAACGGKKGVEVHHKVPVHVDRTQELDPKNLITLCEVPKNGNAADTCHLQIGHLGNWFNWNRNVDKQAYDALILTYPKPGDKPPEFKPAEIKGVNPAQAPTVNDEEPEPTKINRRPKRRR